MMVCNELNHFVGEDPGEGFNLLKDPLAYVQVKDGKGRVPNWRLCPLGEGDVPLNQALEILLTNDKTRLMWNGSMPGILNLIRPPRCERF